MVTARPAIRAGRRHTRDARVAVDEDRATSALTLRCTTVLDGHDAESLAQHRQEVLVVVGLDLDGRAVEGERENGQLNDCPQPQVRSAFGLEMWNPEPWRPSR